MRGKVKKYKKSPLIFIRGQTITQKVMGGCNQYNWDKSPSVNCPRANKQAVPLVELVRRQGVSGNIAIAPARRQCFF
ncbi:hypothetical protein DRO30_03320 [Candidatus Bathyarchaeota archaeon]|nr:MAG: hypothetical protein DRO30_03320 [Candidatus Bathyarchaeota archaeon]